jgi:hypothetical protein
MKLVQANTKKTYELEKLPIVRLMSQGIKLSETVASAMGIDTSDDDNRKINYAIDEDESSSTFNQIFLYKDGAGRTIGSNNCFVNSGLKADMLTRAGVPGLDVKGGNQVHFTVGEGLDVEGTSYFPITFSKVVEAKDDSAEETASESAEPVSDEF